MKFFLATFACLFLAINGQEECCADLDLSEVNKNLGDLKASVLELSACNDLDCTRSIVDRADISLRENADCAVNEINNLVNRLEKRRDEAIENGRNVSGCLADIQKLEDLARSVRDEVNEIVDVLVDDCGDIINRTDCEIKEKETICCCIDKALACQDQACVDQVAIEIREKIGENRCSIRNLLKNARAEVKRKISCASGRIAALLELRKSEARDIANSAEDCLKNCV